MSVTESSAIDTAIGVGRGAALLNHVRQNRLEYLVVLVLFHLSGGIEWASSHAQGVCGL